VHCVRPVRREPTQVGIHPGAEWLPEHFEKKNILFY
jgi:hypothetical protein